MEKFSIKKRFKKITVACHDAGGSEIVASWLNKNKIKFFPFLGGPAKKIFKRRFKKLNIKKLDYALSHSDFVITGTSLKSNLELNVIKKAKKKNLITKSFIDLHQVILTKEIELILRLILQVQNCLKDY